MGGTNGKKRPKGKEPALTEGGPNGTAAFAVEGKDGELSLTQR
ncbi:Uncharacterised protein [Paenibacillus thiaminolyticus]|nr:Uncharacterised protein [Paenibacillus thiaminolyticus]